MLDLDSDCPSRPFGILFVHKLYLSRVPSPLLNKNHIYNFNYIFFIVFHNLSNKVNTQIY